MAEYIEREAVRCKNCIHNVVCVFRNEINNIDEWLDEFGCGDYRPAADVVEVVRCKDCKHCTIYRCRADNGTKQLKCKFGLDIGDENHYCSLGAKMDGKGESE